MLNGCLFAARLRTPGDADRALLLRRVAGLERFYGVFGGVDTRTEFSERLGLLIGAISFGGPAPGGEVLAWGASPPQELTRAAPLLGASDAQLRALPPSLILAGALPDSARLVASAGGTAPLYASLSGAVEAWSSHAVAAAYLAGGGAHVDPEAIPQLVGAEFVGGEDTIIREARALPPAMAVEIGPDGSRERCYWPPFERWDRAPAEQAQAMAEHELLASLQRRLAGAAKPVLGLTAGLDSLTVAAALRETGTSFSAFTYADPAEAEARGAARVAQTLGVPHDVTPIALWDDGDGLSRLHAEVRFGEAGAPVGYGEVLWPAETSHLILGIGAETGRAFYYGWVRPRGPDSTTTAERVLTAYLQGGLSDAEPEVRRRERERWRAWVRSAADMGSGGFDALDVVYAEQRVRRWGRGMTPRLGVTCVPAFAGQELMRSLASLPLRERTSDGFPRRFIGARWPELVPPQPAPGGRRADFTLARRQAVHAGRLLRRALRLPSPGKAAAVPWFQTPPWDARPRFSEWLADEVLRSPLLGTALGDRWLSEQRKRFLRGEAAAGQLTRWAAAAVALDTALREWLENERAVAHAAPSSGDELD